MMIAAVLSAWVQYAADGKPHVRALVTKTCPALTVDGASIAMTTRAPADVAHGFTEVVCEAIVPPDATHIAVGDHPLPAPARRADAVVVFGDTGCRMKAGEQQNCGDPENWPFPRIAQQIAAVHPNLVIDIGDYYYRENNCVPGVLGCVNYWGDTSSAWNADWFHPAAPIFAAAPLFLSRGNHEDCARGGPGWFRFLAPTATTVCPDPAGPSDGTPPYVVWIDGLDLIALDSASDASDSVVDPLRVAYYRRAFDTFSSLSGARPSNVWVVTHRPPYANANMAAVVHAAPSDLAVVTAVIAGHVHDFAALNLAGYPPLIVNGEGGDDLDDMADTQAFTAAQHFTFAAPAPFATKQFGFAVYRRQTDGWSISLRDPEGIERESCLLSIPSYRGPAQIVCS
jgi:hypothetical protein